MTSELRWRGTESAPARGSDRRGRTTSVATYKTLGPVAKIKRAFKDFKELDKRNRADGW
jgi:hypothetical protein